MYFLQLLWIQIYVCKPIWVFVDFIILCHIIFWDILYNLYIFYNSIFNFYSVITIVGPKDLATPAHLISSPRPTPRKKKHPRMNKEGPSHWETSPRTILSSANQGHEGRKRHALKGKSPRASQAKRTNTVGQPWEHGGGAILGEAVTSALNAHS